MGFGAALAPPASATGLEQDVACVGGGTSYNASTSKSAHTVTVTCKDGTDIIYNPGSNQQGLFGLSVNCPGADTVASKIATPNQPNKQIVFYCVVQGSQGRTESTNDTPTVKAAAATNAMCPDGVTPLPKGGASQCPSDADPAITSGNCSNVSHCDLIQKYINPFINFLAALVGVVVVMSIIIGGIQYSSSAGDPQAASAAKNRIRNAIIALVTFLFLYALLNFLIPGGLV